MPFFMGFPLPGSMQSKKAALYKLRDTGVIDDATLQARLAQLDNEASSEVRRRSLAEVAAGLTPGLSEVGASDDRGPVSRGIEESVNATAFPAIKAADLLLQGRDKLTQWANEKIGEGAGDAWARAQADAAAAAVPFVGPLLANPLTREKVVEPAAKQAAPYVMPTMEWADPYLKLEDAPHWPITGASQKIREFAESGKADWLYLGTALAGLKGLGQGVARMGADITAGFQAATDPYERLVRRKNWGLQVQRNKYQADPESFVRDRDHFNAEVARALERGEDRETAIARLHEEGYYGSMEELDSKIEMLRGELQVEDAVRNRLLSSMPGARDLYGQAENLRRAGLEPGMKTELLGTGLEMGSNVLNYFGAEELIPGGARAARRLGQAAVKVADDVALGAAVANLRVVRQGEMSGAGMYARMLEAGTKKADVLADEGVRAMLSPDEIRTLEKALPEELPRLTEMLDSSGDIDSFLGKLPGRQRTRAAQERAYESLDRGLTMEAKTRLLERDSAVEILQGERVLDEDTVRQLKAEGLEVISHGSNNKSKMFGERGVTVVYNPRSVESLRSSLNYFRSVGAKSPEDLIRKVINGGQEHLLPTLRDGSMEFTGLRPFVADLLVNGRPMDRPHTRTALPGETTKTAYNLDLEGRKILDEIQKAVDSGNKNRLEAVRKKYGKNTVKAVQKGNAEFTVKYREITMPKAMYDLPAAQWHRAYKTLREAGVKEPDAMAAIRRAAQGDVDKAVKKALSTVGLDEGAALERYTGDIVEDLASDMEGAFGLESEQSKKLARAYLLGPGDEAAEDAALNAVKLGRSEARFTEGVAARIKRFEYERILDDIDNIRELLRTKPPSRRATPQQLAEMLSFQKRSDAFDRIVASTADERGLEVLLEARGDQVLPPDVTPENIIRELLEEAKKMEAAGLPPARRRPKSDIGKRVWGEVWDPRAARPSPDAGEEFGLGFFSFEGKSPEEHGLESLRWRMRAYRNHLANVKAGASANPRKEKIIDGIAGLLEVKAREMAPDMAEADLRRIARAYAAGDKKNAERLLLQSLRRSRDDVSTPVANSKDLEIITDDLRSSLKKISDDISRIVKTAADPDTFTSDGRIMVEVGSLEARRLAKKRGLSSKANTSFGKRFYLDATESQLMEFADELRGEFAEVDSLANVLARRVAAGKDRKGPPQSLAQKIEALEAELELLQRDRALVKDYAANPPEEAAEYEAALRAGRTPEGEYSFSFGRPYMPGAPHLSKYRLASSSGALASRFVGPDNMPSADHMALYLLNEEALLKNYIARVKAQADPEYAFALVRALDGEAKNAASALKRAREEFVKGAFSTSEGAARSNALRQAMEEVGPSRGPSAESPDEAAELASRGFNSRERARREGRLPDDPEPIDGIQVTEEGRLLSAPEADAFFAAEQELDRKLMAWLLGEGPPPEEPGYLFRGQKTPGLSEKRGYVHATIWASIAARGGKHEAEAFLYAKPIKAGGRSYGVAALSESGNRISAKAIFDATEGDQLGAGLTWNEALEKTKKFYQENVDISLAELAEDHPATSKQAARIRNEAFYKNLQEAKKDLEVALRRFEEEVKDMPAGDDYVVAGRSDLQERIDIIENFDEYDNLNLLGTLPERKRRPLELLRNNHQPATADLIEDYREAGLFEVLHKPYEGPDAFGYKAGDVPADVAGNRKAAAAEAVDRVKYETYERDWYDRPSVWEGERVGGSVPAADPTRKVAEPIKRKSNQATSIVDKDIQTGKYRPHPDHQPGDLEVAPPGGGRISDPLADLPTPPRGSDGLIHPSFFSRSSSSKNIVGWFIHNALESPVKGAIGRLGPLGHETAQGIQRSSFTMRRNISQWKKRYSAIEKLLPREQERLWAARARDLDYQSIVEAGPEGEEWLRKFLAGENEPAQRFADELDAIYNDIADSVALEPKKKAQWYIRQVLDKDQIKAGAAQKVRELREAYRQSVHALKRGGEPIKVKVVNKHGHLEEVPISSKATLKAEIKRIQDQASRMSNSDLQLLPRQSLRRLGNDTFIPPQVKKSLRESASAADFLAYTDHPDTVVRTLIAGAARYKYLGEVLPAIERLKGAIKSTGGRGGEAAVKAVHDRLDTIAHMLASPSAASEDAAIRSMLAAIPLPAKVGSGRVGRVAERLWSRAVVSDPRWVDRSMLALRKLTFQRFLGFNPASMAVNLTQGPLNVIPTLGARYFAEGAIGSASHKAMKKLTGDLDEVDVLLQEMGRGDLAGLFVELNPTDEQLLTATLRGKDKQHGAIFNVGAWFFQLGEQANLATTARATYAKVRDLRRSAEELIQAGRRNGMEGDALTKFVWDGLPDRFKDGLIIRSQDEIRRAGRDAFTLADSEMVRAEAKALESSIASKQKEVARLQAQAKKQGATFAQSKQGAKARQLVEEIKQARRKLDVIETRRQRVLALEGGRGDRQVVGYELHRPLEKLMAAIEGGDNGMRAFTRDAISDAITELQFAYIKENVPMAGHNSAIMRAALQFTDFNRQQLELITMRMGGTSWRAMKAQAAYFSMMAVIAGPYAVPLLMDITRMSPALKERVDGWMKKKLYGTDVPWNLDEALGVNLAYRVAVGMPLALGSGRSEGVTGYITDTVPALDTLVAIPRWAMAVSDARKQSASEGQFQSRLSNSESGLRARVPRFRAGDSIAENPVGALATAAQDPWNAFVDSEIGPWAPNAAEAIKITDPMDQRGEFIEVPGKAAVETFMVGSSIMSRMLQRSQRAKGNIVLDDQERAKGPLRSGAAGAAQSALLAMGFSPKASEYALTVKVNEEKRSFNELREGALTRAAYAVLNGMPLEEASRLASADAGIDLTPQKIASKLLERSSSGFNRLLRGLNEDESAYVRSRLGDTVLDAALDNIEESERAGDLATAEGDRAALNNYVSDGFTSLAKHMYGSILPNLPLEQRREQMYAFITEVSRVAYKIGNPKLAADILLTPGVVSKDAPIMSGNGILFKTGADGVIARERRLTYFPDLPLQKLLSAIRDVDPELAAQDPVAALAAVEDAIRIKPSRGKEVVDTPKRQWEKRHLALVLLAARGINGDILYASGGALTPQAAQAIANPAVVH